MAATRERHIDVRKQVRLSPAKSLRLCVSGIGHRLLRSGLTTAVVVLAVAFFMFMLVESAFVSATAQGVGQEISAHRQADRFLAIITDKPSVIVHLRRLSAVAEDPGRAAMYANVSGFEPARLKHLAQTCRLERRYTRFFDDLRVGQRVILVRKASDRQIFRYLRDDSNWQQFAMNLGSLRSLRLPETIEQFKEFVDGFADFERELGEFEQAWNAAIVDLSTGMSRITGDTVLARWLPSATPEQLTGWRQVVHAAGFALDDKDLAHIVESLRLARTRDEISQELNSSPKKARWRKLFREKVSLDNKMRRLNDARAVQILDEKYDREQLKQVSGLVVYSERLAELEQVLSIKSDEEAGGALTRRQMFLLAISFVVCMVGIANAMLMAITERFREIATMKCLGATDGVIMAQFMMEAGIQGLAGGAVGVLIGFALASLKDGAVFGSYLLTYFPLGNVLVCSVIAMLAGMALATLASLYPSWAASRMAPMEAMRVE